ncbi:ABC transporter ATP-binding protein [Tellurirhabdus bombi]|uniref:ABC transporter ATP-binding protein n=1 Tax=Tellurirhabdus bombi TaxID=2907205 RepID=UPI001F1717B1|nr:ABC transporter ATP-binding protein [Tellurirhabdus bombi]
MNPSMTLLTTRNLSIGYTGKEPRLVAEGLNLALKRGQLVCLLGSNGSGKSTLMRTLACIQPPLSGEIFLEEQPLVSLNTNELARKLSLVLTERIEAGNLLVHELVALGRTPHTGWLGTLTKQDKDKVQEAMEATDTLIYQHRRLQQLSDGERQKVMLARALAQDTDLILLDEPTAHLDLPNRVEMMRLLHRLARQTAKAILLSTHELDLALQAADQLWLLSAKGQLTAGVPEDLVLNGAFETAFASDGFYFDRATGTFTMQRAYTGSNIWLTGESSLVFWTRRALQREGFGLSPTAEASWTIEAVIRRGEPVWISTHAGKKTEHTSIQALLNTLQNEKSQSTNLEAL